MVQLLAARPSAKLVRLRPAGPLAVASSACMMERVGLGVFDASGSRYGFGYTPVVREGGGPVTYCSSYRVDGSKKLRRPTAYQ
eukprot:7027094-Prymnesium_polylepis.1